ncbi:MAG: ATP-binding protein [Clostridia bacterium]|nr:ATP-binding protein [Clostridia bacterium]
MANWQRLGEIGFNLPPRQTAGREEEATAECPICRGRGLVLQDGRARRCRCMDERALAVRRRAAGLTAALQRQTFSAFELRYYEPQFLEMARRTLAAAQEFVRECLEGRARRGLLFTGPVGSGKTFLACAIANALVEGACDVFFVVVPDLLEAIRSGFGRVPEGEANTRIEERARGAAVLILDDLGAHNYTDWTRNTLYSLLNHRLNHELPTVITTNLSLEELDAYLGERTISRIVQHCRVYRLLVHRDIRHLKAAQAAGVSPVAPPRGGGA